MTSPRSSRSGWLPAQPHSKAVLSALLAAETPLRKGELAEAADVSRATLCPSEGNWEALLATGLLEETGSGWRLDLAFHTDDERYSDRLPDLVTDDQLLARDVLGAVVFDVLDDLPAGVTDVWTDLVDGVPDVSQLQRWYRWAEWVVPLLRRLAGQRLGTAPGETPPGTSVAFGAEIEQAPLGHPHEPPDPQANPMTASDEGTSP